MTATSDPRVGTDLGPYRIEAAIGRGGMGVVYRATDTRLDRRVALKILTPELADDETFRARFLRESRLAASIDDPNIIPVYEAGEVGGTYFFKDAPRGVLLRDAFRVNTSEWKSGEWKVALGLWHASGDGSRVPARTADGAVLPDARIEPGSFVVP